MSTEAVRRLPLAERLKRPACESLVSPQTMTWRRSIDRTDMLCGKNATVAIGVEQLCRAHAGPIALDAAIRRGTL